jgi:hypothetical protein
LKARIAVTRLHCSKTLPRSRKVMSVGNTWQNVGDLNVRIPQLSQATVAEAALNELEACWNDVSGRFEVIPGKEAVSMFNQYLQSEYRVSVTPASIVDAMRAEEIPDEIKKLLQDISEFAVSKVE